MFLPIGFNSGMNFVNLNIRLQMTVQLIYDSRKQKQNEI